MKKLLVNFIIIGGTFDLCLFGMVALAEHVNAREREAPFVFELPKEAPQIEIMPLEPEPPVEVTVPVEKPIVRPLKRNFHSTPKTESDWDAFLDALAAVESNSRDGIVVTDVNGKRSYGRLQIQASYLKDSGLNYTLEQVRTSKDVSYKVAKAYLKRYGKLYTKRTGKPATFEVLARIHNGGPSGWKYPATSSYAIKVKGKLA